MLNESRNFENLKTFSNIAIKLQFFSTFICIVYDSLCDRHRQNLIKSHFRKKCDYRAKMKKADNFHFGGVARPV